MRSIGARGRWVIYGLLDTSGQFPWLPAISHSMKISFYLVFEYTGNRHLGLLGDEEAFGRAKHFIGAGLQDESLPPLLIDREFKGLESLPEAMKYMASNQAAGKIAVTPS